MHRCMYVLRCHTTVTDMKVYESILFKNFFTVSEKKLLHSSAYNHMLFVTYFTNEI